MQRLNRAMGCWLLLSGCSGGALGGSPAPAGASGAAGSVYSNAPAVSSTASGALPLAASCERNHASALTDLQLQFDGESFANRADDYDGAALVERSDARTLTLYFDAPNDPNSPPRHVSIMSRTGVPVLPVGARLWMTATPAHNPYPAYYVTPNEPWSFTLRSKQDGTVLVASGYTFTDAASQPAFARLPFAVRSTTPLCRAIVPSPFCAPGGTPGTVEVAYASADVQGDSAVTIGDAETETARLAGLDYDVSVQATAVLGNSAGCTDLDGSYPTLRGGVAIDARAHDLPALIEGLPIVALPSCTRGNAPEPQTRLFALTSELDFDGPVTCAATSPDTVDFTSSDGRNFRLWSLPAGFVPPQLGASLWLKMLGSPVRLSILRETQDGKMLFAQASSYALPLSQENQAELAQVGVSVSAEGGCAYSKPNVATAPPVRLWNVRFGADSLVRSGASGELEVSGQKYEAWVDGVNSLGFTIIPH